MEEKTIFEGKEVEIHRNYHPDGSLNSEWTQTTYQLHGYYRKYYPNGQLAQEQIFRNGNNTSHDFSFYENGNTKSETKEIEGNRLKKVSYFKNGGIQSEIIRDSSQKIVEYNKWWYENGQLASEYFYDQEGKPIGKFHEFFNDGSIKIEGEYINGEPFFYNVFLSPNEQTVIDGEGILHTVIVSKLSDKKSECQIKNGQRNGLSKTFKGGKLSSESFYVNGKTEGKSTQYNLDGSVKEFLYFENGVFTKREKPE